MSLIVIKEKIKAKLATISGIEKIGDYPTMDFQGYPAAVVRTDEKTGEYETTSENYEEYTYTVFLLHPLDNVVYSVVKTREIIEELVDTVQDSFDTDEFLSGISMPSGRVILGVRPTDYKVYENEEGKFCVAEITLVARVSKTI